MKYWFSRNWLNRTVELNMLSLREKFIPLLLKLLSKEELQMVKQAIQTLVETQNGAEFRFDYSTIEIDSSYP